MKILDRRQREMTDVINRFRAVRPRMRVVIRLYPCTTEAPGSCRGFCNPADMEDVAVAVPVDESHLPPDFHYDTGLAELGELKIGDYLHVSVTSETGGYLHLFNLGTTGSVAKLFPHDASSAQAISVNTRMYVTGGSLSPFQQGCYRELGDSEDGSPGRANGYPERLLAVATRENVGVRPSDLFPDWSAYDLLFRSAGSWGKIETAAEWFWDLPAQDWDWGVIEVPVVD